MFFRVTEKVIDAVPGHRSVQFDNNKQLWNSVLRVGVHLANRINFHNRRRVFKQLLPFQSSGSEYFVEEKEHDERKKGAQLCVPEWKGVRDKWLRRQEQGNGWMRGLWHF